MIKDKTFFPITSLQRSLDKIKQNSELLASYEETRNLANRIYSREDLDIKYKKYNYTGFSISIEPDNGIYKFSASTSSEEDIALEYRTISEYEDLLRESLNNDGLVSWEECKALDSMFGTNTLPVFFIDDGTAENYYTSKDSPFSEESNSNRIQGYIPDNVINFISETVNSFVEAAIQNTSLSFEEALKVLYNIDQNAKFQDSEKALPGIYTYFKKGEDGKYSVNLMMPYFTISKKEIEGNPSEEDIISLETFDITDYENHYTEFNLISGLSTIPYDASQEQIDELIRAIKYNLDGDLVNSTATITCTPENNTPKYYVDTANSKVNASESLYYKRYHILNQRLNRLNGPLYHAQRLLESIKFIEDQDNTQDGYKNTYKEDLEDLKVLKHNTLYYLPRTEIVDIAPKGKFIRQSDLDTISRNINDKCLLTCGPCSLKGTCPFYNEDELIKKVCPPVMNLDLWFKDNELILIDENNPVIQTLLEELYGTTEYKFSDITKVYSKNLIKENNFNLRLIEESLENNSSFKYNSKRNSLGWITGGRFGTIHKNNLSTFIDEKGNALVEFPDNNLKVSDLPEYSFMNDTVFLEDLETDFIYSTDNVGLELDYTKNGNTYSFKGDSALKLRKATKLKLFENCNTFDEVYLISEDDTSAYGVPPMICLGRVVDLKYDMNNFDHLVQTVETVGSNALIEISPPPTDKDIAMWNLNMINSVGLSKGINPSDCVDLHTHENQNQFWMKKIYKKVASTKDSAKYYVYNGRERISTGNMDIVMDMQHPDMAEIILGKPPVISYESFIRKVSFQIARLTSSGEDYVWTIPWISPRHYNDIITKYAARGVKCDTLELQNEIIKQEKEKRRVMLPHMKTNLRILVVHYEKAFDNYVEKASLDY